MLFSYPPQIHPDESPSDLESITSNLQVIQEQSKLFLGIFTDVHKDSVDKCVKRLDAALTEFRVSLKVYITESRILKFLK